MKMKELAPLYNVDEFHHHIYWNELDTMQSSVYHFLYVYKI
jgi:hypothetical protein